MKNYKIELGFKKLTKALSSLEAIAFKPMQSDRSNVDATTHRFEYTMDLFFGLLRSLLESKGVEVEYPKDVLREAFKGHLINDEQVWLSMLKDRNLTSHTYDETLADVVYSRIKTYVPVFKSTLVDLGSWSE